MGDVWNDLVRLEPIHSVGGRIEIAYEVEGKRGARATRFLPKWALHLLPMPKGALALVVVNRTLSLTIFHETRLRCCFTHEQPSLCLSSRDLAVALHSELSSGTGLDELFPKYKSLVCGKRVSA